MLAASALACWSQLNLVSGPIGFVDQTFFRTPPEGFDPRLVLHVKSRTLLQTLVLFGLLVQRLPVFSAFHPWIPTCSHSAPCWSPTAVRDLTGVQVVDGVYVGTALPWLRTADYGVITAGWFFAMVDPKSSAHK